MAKNNSGGLFTRLLPDGSPTSGVIGARRLIAVQTFDIARLTTHPVPIIPGQFVAVTGQGPKGDSNGSGKTTFLSAVSLLLADPQWRLDLDGRHAVGLLFRPGAAGLDASAGAAEHGYIVGIFAHDDTGTDDPITVWVRISKRPAHVLMRSAPGLHGVSSGTDQERLDRADAAWNEIPTKSERGSRQLASALYGAAPRCLAYLDTPVRPAVPSLLSQQMTDMSPALIGAALIALTGRDHLLTKELELRRAHADQVEALAEREQEDRRQSLVEDVELEALRRRRDARADLEQADRLWEVFLGKGFLERSEQDTRIEAELGEIEELRENLRTEIENLRNDLTTLSSSERLLRALSDARSAREAADRARAALRTTLGRLQEQLDQALAEREKLRLDAAGADDRTVADHETLTEEAKQREVAALVAMERTQSSLTGAENAVSDIESGRGGSMEQALRLLDEALIPAACLVDIVELDDDATRAEWEPRLWRYRDALVIAPADEERAHEALVHVPGSVLVLADGDLDEERVPHPHGVTSTVGLGSFLRTLGERQEHRLAPDRVHDSALLETLMGGFTEPFLGRAARLARARGLLAKAVSAHQASTAELKAAILGREHSERLLAAARARQRLAEQLAAITAAERVLSTTRAELDQAEESWDSTDKEHSKAKSAFDNHEATIKRLGADIKDKETLRGKLKRDHGRLCEERDRLRLDDWRAAWGNTPEAAAELVADHHRPATRLLDQTIAQLRTALGRLIRETEPVSPALAQIAADFDAREHPLERGAPHRAAYATVTQPIRDLLDAKREHDELLHERIHRGRAERESVIGKTREELATKADELAKQQDMVENSVESALHSISDRFDQLDLDRGAYGARLEVEIVRPTGPTEGWVWRVTPRWRRSPLGSYVSYREVANGAQIKVFAIQLVLAALLADSSVPGRLLVLDELGNSLGDANRKDVLSALGRVAAQQGVTILGTCQDSVIYDAAGECGEILWFSHASTTDPYNQPTRAWGFDPDGQRVELTADWLMEGRRFPD